MVGVSYKQSNHDNLSKKTKLMLYWVLTRVNNKREGEYLTLNRPV